MAMHQLKGVKIRLVRIDQSEPKQARVNPLQNQSRKQKTVQLKLAWGSQTLRKQKRPGRGLNLEYLCDKCPRRFSSSRGAGNHRNSHAKGKQPTECSFCGKTFTTPGYLRIHTRIHTNEKSLKCSYCPAIFVHSNSLQMHMRSLHTREKPHKCRICGQSFVGKTNLTHHERTHADRADRKLFKCNLCEKSYLSLDYLNTHRAAVHDKLRAHKCRFCPASFAYKSTLTAHIRRHNNEKPYSCDVCDRTFSQRAILTNHKKTHQNPTVRLKKCEICTKSVLNFKQHQDRVHSGHNATFPCQFCSKVFTLKLYLTKHLKRVHTTERNHSCRYCGKSFRDGCDRNVHERIHTGEKRYECKTCTIKFTHPASLLYHQRRHHSSERPFKCDQCGAAYLRARDLRVHKVSKHPNSTDESIQMHPCTYCDKSFLSSYALGVHIRSHTGEKPFQCAHCSNWYASKAIVMRHIRRKDCSALRNNTSKAQSRTRRARSRHAV